MMRYLALLLMVFLIARSVWAQAENPTVSAKLLADHADVAAGESFMVGVMLDVPEGWHIYWKNPGDAGLATSVKWTVPEGFAVSDLMWPVPMQFVQAGNIEGYGYENSVMLLARVTPPAGYTGNAALTAQVRWLACKDTCIPGKAKVATTVQVGSAARPANAEAFAQWLKRLPTEAGAGPISVAVRRAGLSYELVATGLPEGGDLQVFVAPPDGITVKSVQRDTSKAVVEFSKLPGATVGGQAEVVLMKEDKAVRVLLPFG